MIARPSSPDNVVPVREVVGLPVAQVCVGSCVNSSYEDLATVAAVIKGETVHSGVSLTVSPGSRQALTMIAESGVLADLVSAGARVLEAGCGPCIGMGQAPATGTHSVRSFCRNFRGRSGTQDDLVYLASPATCAATALNGQITDPRDLGEAVHVGHPLQYAVSDNMIVAPPIEGHDVSVLRGPNIQPVPVGGRLEDTVRGRVLLKAGDNITTDHIIPGGAEVLPLRSNIPVIAQFVFSRVDREFVKRAKQWGGGVVVGGLNYGQGSSREHAALAPMYLGLRAVIAKSFSRIHHANLVNVGILPLEFVASDDYDGVETADELVVEGVQEALCSGSPLIVRNVTQRQEFEVRVDLTPRQVDILLAGGLLNLIKETEA
jgi:aconitate hydratase